MPLITPEYRDQLQALRRSTEWGPGQAHHYPLVKKHLIDRFGCKSVIDYGCGLGGLVRELDRQEIEAWGYDPAVPQYQDCPDPKDGLCCIDVLEHIEPHLLGDVLEHIGDLFTKGAYLVIHLGPAIHHLPDGRNAHLIIQPAEWWIDALNACDFEIEKVVGVTQHRLQVIVT